MASGCATRAMKGTPFYTGEYSIRKGPVEDRVNVWPLFYYREPALSALWPLIEKTEDHFAFRPIYSIYGLDDGKPVHNVIWPIAQYNTETGEHRVFPVFWSRQKDYVYIFPLYWHSKDPLGIKGGSDGFFPLWIICRDKRGHDYHFLWPIMNFRKRNNPYESSWRVWPVAGRSEDSDSIESYYLWPLIWNHLDKEDGAKIHAFLPLYYSESDSENRTFLSLPYSLGSSKTNDTSWQFVFPLFYNKRDADGRMFVSLPYWCGSDSERDRAWSMLIPFYYTSREKGETRWFAFPLLSGGHRGKDDSDAWMLGPLAHYGHDQDSRSSHVFPFYYSSIDTNSATFVSLPWSSGRKGNDSWQLVPLLYFNFKSNDGKRKITPLYATGQDSDGRAWHAVVPLYYRNRRRDVFASSVFVCFAGEGGRKTMIIPPLASWYSADKTDGDLWLAGPLAHWGWGQEGCSAHVFPLFYADSRKGNFVSLPYAQWESKERVTYSVPPLLSWASAGPDKTDLWMLGPMAHWSWGEKAEKKHVFPLFYSDKAKDKMISPLWASWKDKQETTWACPPALSWFASDGREKKLNALLGIFNQEWGRQGKSGHLVPLYLYKGREEFYTPVFGWNTSEETRYAYPLTPLIGFWYGDHAGWWLQPLASYKRAKETGEVGGNFLFWGRYWKKGGRGGSSMFPIYCYKNFGPLDDVPEDANETHAHNKYGREFLSLPLIWYRNQVVIRPWLDRTENSKSGKNKEFVAKHIKKHLVFPIWHYYRADIPEKDYRDVDSSILWLLYDYRYEMRGADKAQVNRYTRRRILWRLWHYERLNNEVSVDIFPAITYDRKENGFKRVSFLWKLFRYEREPDGNRKLHFFFIPLMK